MTVVLAIDQSPQLFGAEHLILLGVTALASVLAVWGIRRIANDRIRTKIIQAAGWILLVIALFQTIWSVLPGNWNINSALPLHYSDILRFITAAALIWQVRWAAAVSYYWGLTLNLQAIVTPHPTMLVGSSMGFLLYWVLHIFVFVAPLVLVWGTGFRPQWKDFLRTWVLAIGWALFIMPINAWLGTNYGFVNHQPEGASLIDWLGPWPIYVLWMVLFAGALWALMTWPWTRARARDDHNSHTT